MSLNFQAKSKDIVQKYVNEAFNYRNSKGMSYQNVSDSTKVILVYCTVTSIYLYYTIPILYTCIILCKLTQVMLIIYVN